LRQLGNTGKPNEVSVMYNTVTTLQLSLPDFVNLKLTIFETI